MIDTLLHVTAGLLLALLLRKPARRAFGAGPALGLWLLPVSLVALPCLPAVPAVGVEMPTILALPTIKHLLPPAAPAAFAPHGAMALWITGALLAVIRLGLRYGSMLRQTLPVPLAMARALSSDGIVDDLRRVRLHPSGPAVLWAPRGLLLLPPDFLERFDSAERRLVLRHETAHLRHGDTWWNLLAELATALLWFHPLAWLAMPRFRLDLELACDERVLRQSPQDETAYAKTLLHSIGMNPMPVLIPWLAEPQLKERLTMIRHFRPGALRRRAGFIALASLMLTSAIVAQAAQSSRSDRDAHADLSYNLTAQPRYPADAVKQREQGNVILTVLVGTDGKVHKIKVDPTTQAPAALVQSTIDAVSQWHFNPAMKNGKPVAAYARVPVNFTLTEPTAKVPASPALPTQPALPALPAPAHASPSL